MPIILNHIGIAVADLPGVKKLFSILGMETTHLEPVPEQGVRTHFLPFEVEGEREAGRASCLELLEVTDPEGTVAKFIQKRGAGIHHLSFRVAQGELDPLCAKLKAEGYKLTYDAPRPGAHHMRVNFIHPASAGGMLIEVMEPSE
jgi:methylmalonyl-CoA/ethylmalonyl-CoA epimerase